MNNKNILALAVLAATSVTSVNVMAEQSATVTVEANVSNAFVFDNTAPLKFGKIRATSESGSVATYKISANPAGSAPTSSKAGKAIIEGLDDTFAPAVFKISGVANYATLNIKVPSIVPVKHSQPGSREFTLSKATVYAAGDITMTQASSPTASTFDTGTLTALADGTLDFTMGGTLSTSDAAGDTQYIDGPYTGSFDVVVSY